ncbi:hypothetical protein ACGFX4_38560 [Kitasatospora sp. NPDC048365]|uniref:hypothetical protein n=1 Tax=Kitasatospora sp. NPDC048365 TaxID=3364050 RepID=UPI0037223956
MTQNRRQKQDLRAHQAATAAGFMVTRRYTILLGHVMQEHPELGDFGIGVFDPRRKTAAQRQTELATHRRELARSVAGVMQTVAWLDGNVTPIKTPTYSSYGVKHIMERDSGLYVTNGVFIAAALIAGYPHSYDRPNVLFGMSARDLKRLS